MITRQTSACICQQVYVASPRRQRRFRVDHTSELAPTLFKVVTVLTGYCSSLPFIHCLFTACSILFTSSIWEKKYPLTHRHQEPTSGLACSLPVHCLCTAIHCLFTAYSLPIHCLFTAYSLPMHCLFAAYSLYIHCIFTAYSLPIYCPFTAYSLRIHCLFTDYSLPITAYFHLMELENRQWISSE
jgi:hypothetical protein